MTLCHYRVIARNARFDRTGDAAGPEGGPVRNDHRHTHHRRDTATLGITPKTVDTVATPKTVDTVAAHPASVRRTHPVRQRPRRLVSHPVS
jgi:hypothetical protein